MEKIRIGNNISVIGAVKRNGLDVNLNDCLADKMVIAVSVAEATLKDLGESYPQAL